MDKNIMLTCTKIIQTNIKNIKKLKMEKEKEWLQK